MDMIRCFKKIFDTAKPSLLLTRTTTPHILHWVGLQPPLMKTIRVKPLIQQYVIKGPKAHKKRPFKYDLGDEVRISLGISYRRRAFHRAYTMPSGVENILQLPRDIDVRTLTSINLRTITVNP